MPIGPPTPYQTNLACRGRILKALCLALQIEQERGISISSTALQFEYKGMQLNLLDTPGHEVSRFGLEQGGICYQPPSPM